MGDNNNTPFIDGKLIDRVKVLHNIYILLDIK